MTFAKWMDRIDDSCKDDRDMAIHILPAADLRSAYRRGVPPEQFASRILISIRAAMRAADQTQPAR